MIQDRGYTACIPEPPTAHLDEAHVGDIKGAWGTINRGDTAPRKTLWTRLVTLLVIAGPGLVVMIGDNDAGGVATYAQAGQNYGTGLLWTLFLLIPVLIVNQEMVVRLGLVSGVGHARLILERFGTFWGLFSVGDLFVLNFLTIITEFIGLDLGLGYFGISRWLSIPLAAVFLIVATVTGSFRRWERFMYLLIVVNLAIIPLTLLGHPHWGQVAHDWFVPSFPGGLNSTILLLIIGIVGTTVAPWQLFFQQSNVIDKRLAPRWYRYEFADTIIGSAFTQIGAAGLMIVCAFAFTGTRLFGQFTDAGGVAAALTHTIGSVGGVLFALFLIDASLIGAAAVTLSTSYAFGDVFRIKHSLHRSLWDGRAFYAMYSVLVVAAAAVVLFANQNLLGLLTLAVQVLAGILLPSATVFLLLLCNDKAVLGPWVNPTWLNIVASLIVGVLVELSLILAVATLFPNVDAVSLTLGLTAALTVGLLVAGGLLLRRGRQGTPTEPYPARSTWQMPPLAELTRPARTIARDIGLLVLRGYLILAAVLVAVKFIQLALGH